MSRKVRQDWAQKNKQMKKIKITFTWILEIPYSNPTGSNMSPIRGTNTQSDPILNRKTRVDFLLPEEYLVSECAWALWGQWPDAAAWWTDTAGLPGSPARAPYYVTVLFSCGSAPLTKGSGFGSCYFPQWPSKLFFSPQFFLLITVLFEDHLHPFSKIKITNI